ncbi:MAG: PKD domain-containing protein [Bacteroidetes bacterium]|nr:PKD domain-containing protein [Bacteroidota bacterium]
MKNSFILSLLILFSKIILGQNNISKYEYWFDNDYSNTTITSISPTNQLNLNSIVPTAGLSNGIHVFNFRAQQTNGKYSTVVSQFFYKTTQVSSVSRIITEYEYWFDNNYSNAIHVSTPNQQQVNINQLIQTSSLTSGIHTFNIRFKDNTNLWSSAVSQFFYKAPTVAATNREIIAYEYWFDNNHSNAITTTITAQQQVNINQLIQTASITNGIHTFNIRFKDNSNLWSSAVSQFFYKTPSNNYTNRNLVAYQYWFDNDYTNAISVSTPSQQQVNLNQLIQTSTLTNGIHTFSIRFKDNSDLWSSALSQFFYKLPNQQGTNNHITAYRYWINSDFNNHVLTNLPSPVQQLNLNDVIDFTQFTKGRYAINFQFKDERGLWSVVTTDSLTKNLLPIAQFSADSLNYCDQATVTFSNTSVDSDTYLWDFGDGATSTNTLATHTYTAPGLYEVSLTATDANSSIDSVLVKSQYIRVYQTPSSTINVVGNNPMCAGTTITLSATSNANYLWSNSSTSQSIYVNSAGIYSATVSNIDFPQCYAESNTVTVSILPAPQASYTATDNGLIVQFNNLSSNANTYLWNFGDGNTSIAPSPQHTYGSNNLYNTYLIAYNTCGSDTSYLDIDLLFVSNGEVIKVDRFKIFPNPSQNFFNISLNDLNEGNIECVLMDAQGKIVLQNTLESLHQNVYKVDVSELANGSYYLVIKTKSGKTSHEKIIVNR